MKRVFFLLAALLAVSAPAFAAGEPKLLGSFSSWNAYTYQDDGGKVCFMSSLPEKQKSSADKIKRDPAHFFLTHWAGEKTRNVISVEAGYPFKPDSKPTLAVNGKTYTLFVDGERAWSKDQATDDAIAVAIRKGSSLTVKGVSKRGTETTDTYNLKGSGDAYKAISKECDIQ